MIENHHKYLLLLSFSACQH